MEIIDYKTLEQSPDAVILVSNLGDILWNNKSTTKIFGYKNDELVNQKIELLLPQDQHLAHEQNRNEFFMHPSSRSMGRGLKLVGIRKNGDAFRVEVSLNPVKTASGLQVICTICDLSAYLAL